ncbi:MAG TPA: APC family permease [Actinomycetota bacterium]|nr:APC family permease [Actinomycetota bacterium]
MSASSKTSSGSVAKRVLVGRAFSSGKLEHTLLPKVLALPVFASDALSSVAYASGEILFALTIATTAPSKYVMPISFAIAALMAIVVSSYRQTVRAYPGGGGAYIVSRENLGAFAGLVAAAALLFDYMMTVVVSIAAGVLAIGSAFPWALEHKVLLSILFVVFITVMNLRGTKESGTLFAIPTYGFVVSILLLVGAGLVKCLGECPSVVPAPPEIETATAVAGITLFVILKAFSQGATALTGVEAISNGVPAFKRPQARNAAATLAIMGTIAVTMFLGISYLVTHVHGVVASEEQSAVAQIAVAVFGNGSLGFYVVQAFTAAILILAANTAYQDFPRLASILGRDRYMPSQFVNRGDRLVFSNGVIVLGLLSCVMLYVYHADLNQLIHFYVVGVFTSFTLSQSGMIRHWIQEGRKGEAAMKGWRRSIVINIIGAVTTFVVLIVVVVSKFKEGARLSILIMGLLVVLFYAIQRHYTWVRSVMHRGVERVGIVGENHVVLLVRDVDAAAAEALGYVRSYRPQSVHAVTPGSSVPLELAERWGMFGGTGAPPLTALGSGSLTSTVRRFIATLELAPHDVVTVVVPEMVGEHLSSHVVRTKDLVRLKASLLRIPHVVVTDVPVVATHEGHGGVDAKPLIPRRTVSLVFLSGVNDLTIRAVNYAKALESSVTRAIYFDLDPEAAHRLETEWFDAGLEIPLDIVEAPFRDLTGPMLDEVRRFSSDPGTVVNVIVPEVVVSHWWQLPLHNQNALFIKRLFLFEDRVALTSVPMLVKGTPTSETETV